MKLSSAEGFDFGFEDEGAGFTGGRVCEEVEDGEEGARGVLEGRSCAWDLSCGGKNAGQEDEGGEEEMGEGVAMIHEFAFRDG